MESNIRKLVKQYMDGLQWESALLWAEVAVTLSSGNVDDTVSYLRCLMQLGHHLRALSLLENRALLRAHKVFQYFGSQCLFASHRYEEVVQLIEGPISTDTNGGQTLLASSYRYRTATFSAEDLSLLSKYADQWKIESGLLLLLGKAHEKLENRQQAALVYKQCVLLDFSCIEAFDRLIRGHMISEAEERDLFNRLSENEAKANRSTAPLLKLAKFLYKRRSMTAIVTGLAAENSTEEENGETELKKKLAPNLSLMVGDAERLYYQSKYRESYELTTQILSEEEYHSDALPVHVGNMVALSKTTQLFSLAHKLIDSFPDLLISWYAVACYYYSISSYEAAKRFFHKCTLLDPHHGPSWIGYGHSFAVEQEHDQAMNCYVKAAKVMGCCHLPLIYVGLEYSLTNNLRLAEKFCLHASTMAPNDPYVLHEFGVLFFRLENYIKAEEYFKKAEKAVPIGSPAWEQLWNNIGHVMRKLKRYSEALEYHRRALRLAPRNASTLAAIGYSHMFLEQYTEAVDYFHQSLSLKRDDAFVTSLLTKSMDILNDTWKTSFAEPPILNVPSIRVQGTPSKKTPRQKSISEADDAHSDVEMEDA